MGQESSVVTAVVQVNAIEWVQCLAWELLHAASMRKKKKKEEESSVLLMGKECYKRKTTMDFLQVCKELGTDSLPQ